MDTLLRDWVKKNITCDIAPDVIIQVHDGLKPTIPIPDVSEQQIANQLFSFVISHNFYPYRMNKLNDQIAFRIGDVLVNSGKEIEPGEKVQVVDVRNALLADPAMHQVLQKYDQLYTTQSVVIAKPPSWFGSLFKTFH